jgi:hypothetical protein
MAPWYLVEGGGREKGERGASPPDTCCVEKSNWDPEDPEQQPAWRAASVLNILRGLDFERDDLRFARGSKSDVLQPLQTFRFACGCVAADDTGWQSCGEGLHATLSAETSRSPLVAEFLALRGVFDAVLAEAWRRRGGEPDHYYEFHEARAKAPFLPFDKWKETADLCGENVWQSGILVASLTSFPGEEEIALRDGGGSRRGEFVLELRGENRDKMIPADIRGAIAAIFTD